METRMRYVQQRVERFILRATNGVNSRQWPAQQMNVAPDSCVIVNLSLGGASVLVPKNLVLPSNNLRLQIPSPQYPEIEDTTITANVRWTDLRYSIGRKKIGLQFMKYGNDDKVRLRRLIDWFSVCERTVLPCVLQL